MIMKTFLSEIFANINSGWFVIYFALIFIWVSEDPHLLLSWFKRLIYIGIHVYPIEVNFGKVGLFQPEMVWRFEVNNSSTLCNVNLHQRIPVPWVYYLLLQAWEHHLWPLRAVSLSPWSGHPSPQSRDAIHSPVFFIFVTFSIWNSDKYKRKMIEKRLNLRVHQDLTNTNAKW